MIVSKDEKFGYIKRHPASSATDKKRSQIIFAKFSVAKYIIWHYDI